MVLEPPNVCHAKKDFYRGKHHLEVNKMHFYLALITSPPDPLSTMEQSNSRQQNAERGKEIEKGLAGRAPFSKMTSWSSPDGVQTGLGEGKRGGGKQFEAIGNRKIIARQSGTYVKFPHHLEENH
jgi:hypothetical protein